MVSTHPTADFVRRQHDEEKKDRDDDRLVHGFLHSGLMFR